MLKTSLLLTFASAILPAQVVEHINPPGMNKSPAYTQVVTASPGKIVWVAGQVGENAKGELAGKDLKSQLNQAWANVKIALEAAGASFKDVVKTTTYVKNYSPSMRPDIREARLRAMGNVEPPASTLVGVQSLATDEWLVEIEVTAVVR
jgi:enamine deaminase RidA (YjgF/YER057c/UK114 family)